MNGKPAPFFNYRKRQRQPIVCDSSQITSDASKNYDSKEFQSTSSNNSRISGQKQSALEARNEKCHSNPNRLVVRSGLMDMSGNITQGTNKAPFSSGIRNFNNSGTSSGNQLNSGTPTNQQQPTFSNNQYQCSFSNNQENNRFANNQQPSKIGNSCKVSSMFPANMNRNSYLSNQNMMQQSPINSTSTSSLRKDVNNTYSPAQQHSSYSRGYNSVQSQHQNAPHNTWSSMQNNAGPNYQQRSSVWCSDNQDQTKAKKEKPKQFLDTSLRIMTCPISTMREWSKLKAAQGLTMFEIFGIVDSAVLKTKDGLGKEFMLKDDSSKIKCIFFEIDRELPKLTRGQVHRVIGSLDMCTDVVKVVAVRPAETGEQGEQQLCFCAMQFAQKEMEKLAGDIHEQ